VADDIVERLRRAAVGLPQDDMNQTAADEIERLRAEAERLTDELRQVANEIALAESQEARREV
jgi:HAMP domain-containing protein